MALLIGLNCASNARNTGNNLCVSEFGLPAGFILVPPSVSYSPAQTKDGATFLAALQASAYNVNPALRIYPFMGINGTELANTDATTETSGYGDIRTLLLMKMGFVFSYWGKGPCWNANALAFDGKEGSYTMMLVDQNGVVAGTVLPNGNMTGYDLTRLNINPRTVTTGSAGSVIAINVMFRDGVNQWGKNWAYVQTDNAATSLKGLNDIYLQNVTANVTPTPAAGTYYIKVLASCGGTSIAAAYPTIFASITTGSPFTIANAANNNVITMLTNTYNQTYDAMQIGVDTTDTDYTAATNIKASLSDTSVLSGLGVIGFEAVPNSITFAK